MGLLDDYKQLLTNERQKQKLNGLLGVADTVTGADQIRGIPADPRNWSIDDTAKMLNFAGGGIGAIKTYHGSPHKFDAFDMSKIGTGEGAQAYGHGLYFAENPEIAEGYKKALSGGSYVDKRGMPVQPNEIASDIYEAARKGGADVQEASDASSFWSLYLRDGDKMSNSPGYKYIKDVIDGRGITFKDHGNLYNVSLEWPDAAREAADPLGPQHFLDWDKPLSEQPESVLRLLNTSALQNKIDDIYKKYPSNANPDDLFDPAWFSSNVPDHEQLKINDLQNKINSIRKFEGVFKESGGGLTGGNLIKRGEKNYSPELTSKTLSEIGIPGIRYLDGSSRAAGDGTYNYVVFDDQIPRIVERNGKPVGLLGK